jgi:hypothetical protein
MSNKSKHHTKGAFGGDRGRRRKAQLRFLATRGKNIEASGLPGSRIKIIDAPTCHVTERTKEADASSN